MSETFIYDYSFGRPDPGQMKQAGAAGVARYLAPLPNAKVLTADERDGLLAAGLSITLVWETVAQRAASTGYGGGIGDAQHAIQMATDLGLPAGACIYYVLEDPSQIPRSQWPAALDYARGTHDVHQGSAYENGGYGGQALVEAAIGQGLIVKGWQVEGWSSSVSSQCHLYQRSNGRNHPMADTDENVCLQPDWGQWPRPFTPPPLPNPPTQQEEPMSILVRFGDKPEVYAVNALGYRHVVSELERDKIKLFGLCKTDPSWENGCVNHRPETDRAVVLIGKNFDA